MFSIANITRLNIFIPKILRARSVYVSNTRLGSQAENPNDTSEVNPNYENRNPRSLESTGHQYKRTGWNLHYPSKEFYYR